MKDREIARRGEDALRAASDGALQTGVNTRVELIPTESFRAFPRHPFKVDWDEDMRKLAESIREVGVLLPVLARRMPDGTCELISGHRRVSVCRRLGISVVPAILIEMTDDEATVVMVDSNLSRSRIRPSEKAFAYQMKLEALNRKKGRPKKSDRAGPDFKGKSSAEIVGMGQKDSATQVKRYIRLTNLIPELLELVDQDRIALSVAVELSYLSVGVQRLLADRIEEYMCTPSYPQAVWLRRRAAEPGATAASLARDVETVMTEEKPNQREMIKLHYDRIRDFIPGSASPRETENYIVAACRYYWDHICEAREENLKKKR